MVKSIINLADSYKFSHFKLYPKGTETIHSYLAPRGGEFEEVYFCGLTYYLKEYLTRDVSYPQIHIYKKQAEEHGVPFNEEGWKYIVEKHNGKLPIIIKALPEGTITTNKRPLLTIENTDPNCAWLVGYLETLLLKIWYPTTVASKSLKARKILLKHWEKTATSTAGIDFAFHNFGDRGSTSVESASIGGEAHLNQFKGTDNFCSLDLNKEFYDGRFPGYSIPASEHSTITSWGRENEFDFYEHYLETYKNSPIIACVMDSYDIYKAVDFVTSGKMKEKIESKDYPIFVIRPDSGDAPTVIDKIILKMMENDVKLTINDKGHAVFDKYRIIWGDGITIDRIDEILSRTCYTWYQRANMGSLIKISAENFAFGSGGDLMQNVTRDSLKFAYKCSAIKVNGEWHDVYKDPITDPSKKSLRGRIEDPEFITVFENGRVLI